MEGHRIPDKIEQINKEWFNEGCICYGEPEYIKNITVENLERNYDGKDINK